jgi:phosphoacetylglucosamine mutase
MCHNRRSSHDLAQAAITGITAMGGEVKDYGVVTTPMLHYFVASINADGMCGQATEDGYFQKLTTAFKELRGDVSFVTLLL